MSGRDLEEKKWTARLAGPLRALVIAAAVTWMAAPAGLLAQGLPSADELETTEPEDEAAEQAAPQEAPAPEAASEEAADEPAEAEQPSEEPASQADEETAEESSEPAESAQTSTSMADAQQGEVDTRLPGDGVNLEGARGFMHIASAMPGKPNTYRVAFLSSFTSGADFVRANDENEFVAGNLLFQATILEHLSANIGLRASNNVNTFGRPQSMLAQGDVHFGLRGHLEPQPGVFIAGDVTTYFPTGFSSAGLDASAASVRPRLLASADFGQFLPKVDGRKVPLTGHFNFGYLFDNTSNLVPEDVRPTRVERFAHDISGYDYLEFGLGFEYALPYVSPFLAWNLDVPVNADEGVCAEAAPLNCASEEGFAAFPNVLSIGARAEPIENLGLTAGLDIGLTSEDAAGVPVTAPWQLVLGASWAIDPEPKIEYVEKVVEKEKVIEKMPPRGFMVGTVTDQNTGEPIEGAVIVYIEGDKSPQATDSKGVFRSYGFEPGTEIAFKVRHPDYEPTGTTQTIEEEGEVEVDVSLRAIPKKGTIGGVVIDQDGEPIANATVTLAGIENVEINTGEKGEFTREVSAGPVTVAARAEGYLTGGRDVEVAGDKELALEITLKPEPKEKLVEVEEDRIRIKEKVFFETGKAKILPRSYNVLNQVASVLLENPRLEKVRIEGHTDDVGAEDYNKELSQDRAASVRKYLMEQGISPERLVAEGYGESQPLVPNVSDRNRSLNRRVEFRIIDQGLDEAKAGEAAEGEQN